MNYKLLALDMDGTLLRSDKTISKPTANAIETACNSGKYITISTGRPIQGLTEYENIIKPDVPVITYNGAMIIKLHSHEVILHRQIDTDSAREVLEFGQKFNTTIIVWSDNKLYVNRINDKVQNYKLLSGIEPILLTDNETVLNQGITKILWIDDEKKHIEYQSILDSQLINRHVSYCTSQPVFLEFMPEGVSKASALKQLGELLNIKQEEIIAAGDGYNDLPMIEYAGLGVAMDNAPDDVKKAADYITAGNDNEGISLLIENVLLKSGA